MDGSTRGIEKAHRTMVEPGEGAAMQPDVLYDLALRELVEEDESLRERIREAEDVQPAEEEALDEGGES
ncbi:MAG: hypothetical protein ACREJ9_14530 [Candidatus Rokuibacteriota bacterium]